MLEVIHSTADYFEKHGIEQPRLNIEHLLAHVLGQGRMELYLGFDRVLGPAELELLRGLVRRRALGEPLQHLVGTVEFLGRSFKVDKRALIPRPETEQLVELILAENRTQRRILDVGTGSGVIALTFAAEVPGSRVEACDVSEVALTLARENAVQLGLGGRVHFVQSDLLGNVAGEFDLIVANLPYIDTCALDVLPREVQHDPRLALDGGPDGLGLLERLIPAASQHLRGSLALEIGDDQAVRLSAALAEHKYQDIRTLPDYQGRSRFLFANYG